MTSEAEKGEESTERRLTFTIQQVARILLAHEGIHEGDWEIGLNIGGQTMFTKQEPDDETWAPSLLLRFVSLNLVEKSKGTPVSIKAD